MKELAAIRHDKKVMKYLRPDAKSQVTIEYDDNKTPLRIDTIVVSTQHDDFNEEKKMLAEIKKDVAEILIPRVKKLLPKRIQKLFDFDFTLHVNPTGKFVIGQTTPSYDLETEISPAVDFSHLSESEIRMATRSLIGNIQQVPPLHSAIKVDGKRAYSLARQGKNAELKPREVTVHNFEITNVSLPEVSFKIVCSKGTYIRSLARDFGNALGVGAYLSELCRTRIGDFKLEDAVTIEEVER